MWIGSYDFYKLEFYEPAYYGQNYNTMLEALLAAPFFRFASPAYILPIVTSTLALFPYFILAIVCYRKQLKVQSLFIMAIPLLLPPEYDFITSMPRGFVTGIFFAVLASIYVYYQDKKWSFFLFAFFSVLGFALNPNGILYTLPCGLFLLYQNYKKKSFYIQSALGGALAAIYPLYISYFYQKYPNYLVHELWTLRFSFESLKMGLTNLSNHFGSIAPIYWYHSTMVILIFTAIPVIFLIQKKYSWTIISVITILLTLLTFGVNKIYDGDGSVFLPVSRMYLAIPFMIVLWVSFMEIKKWKIPVALLLVITCCSFMQRTIIIDDVVDTATIPPKNSLLTAYKMEPLEADCDRIYELVRRFDVNRIIVAHHWADKYLSYACPSCNTDIPLTLTPSNDRRTWRLLQEKDLVYKTILFIDETQQIKEEALVPGKKPIELIALGNNTFLLQNNSLTILELIKRLNIELRSF